MYTGRVIEELVESVERAEQHARAMSAPDMDLVRAEVRQVRDTFIYNFSYNQELVGVA
ncbi:MAG TPA: hypothetical protein VMS96_01900 [Terriglobales bacterium]|nr:hypothetical protein [Terriglobales bacterium]